MSRLGSRARWVLQPKRATGQADAIGVPTEQLVDLGDPIRCLIIQGQSYQTTVAGRPATVRSARILTEADVELDGRDALVGEVDGREARFQVEGTRAEVPGGRLRTIRTIEVLP